MDWETTTTHGATDPVLRELQAREQMLQWPQPGTSFAVLDALLDAQFREFGASGRCYGRDVALSTLVQRARQAATEQWTMEQFGCQTVADNIYLLTYTLRQPGHLTRRSTLWRRDGEGWHALFHQGTPIANATPV